MIRLALLIGGLLLAAPAIGQSPTRTRCEAAGGTFTPARGGGRCDPAPIATAVDAWAITSPAATAVDVGEKFGDTHVLKSATIPTGITYADERGRTRSWVVNRYPAGSANSLTLERFDVTCTDTCIHISRDNDGVVVRDGVVRAAGLDTKDGYRAGVKFDGTVHDALIERVHSIGWFSTAPKGYPNGDSFANERGNYNVTYRYTVGEGATDRNYDLKSSGTKLEHTRAINGNIGYGLHGSGVGTDVSCEAMRKTCLQVRPATNWAIDGMKFGPVVPQEGDVKVEGDTGRLFLNNCDRPAVLSGNKKGFANIVREAGC